MDTEKQLQTMEDELKLLKGELKETLSSVRDYLLNMETTDGNNTPLSSKNSPLEEAESKEPVDKSSDTTEKFLLSDDEDTEDILETDEPLLADLDIPFENHPDEYPESGKELNQSIPRVSFLTNLISWVSVARREIGDDQLPAFLEVYGISGHLSPEMKDIILHLAKITAEKPGGKSTAEVWSNSMLSLHGILSGGETPITPVKPNWDEPEKEMEIYEDEPPQSQVSNQSPVKLKLVFPNGDGKSKEYCIDLSPESIKKGKANG